MGGVGGFVDHQAVYFRSKALAVEQGLSLLEQEFQNNAAVVRGFSLRIPFGLPSKLANHLLVHHFIRQVFMGRAVSVTSRDVIIAFALILPDPGIQDRRRPIKVLHPCTYPTPYTAP